MSRTSARMVWKGVFKGESICRLCLQGNRVLPLLAATAAVAACMCAGVWDEHARGVALWQGICKGESICQQCWQGNRLLVRYGAVQK